MILASSRRMRQTHVPDAQDTPPNEPMRVRTRHAGDSEPDSRTSALEHPMEHVVFFPAHDGSPAFRRVASLEDAVRLVEHLRNSEGVDHVSVHALTEVPLSFR